MTWWESHAEDNARLEAKEKLDEQRKRNALRIAAFNRQKAETWARVRANTERRELEQPLRIADEQRQIREMSAQRRAQRERDGNARGR